MYENKTLKEMLSFINIETGSAYFNRILNDLWEYVDAGDEKTIEFISKNLDKWLEMINNGTTNDFEHRVTWAEIIAEISNYMGKRSKISPRNSTSGREISDTFAHMPAYEESK